MLLDRAAAGAEAAGNHLVILIARLGDGERSSGVARKRLRYVKWYLTVETRKPVLMVVTAEGERTSGYGSVEVYVNGQLLYVLRAGRNRNFLFTCG